MKIIYVLLLVFASNLYAAFAPTLDVWDAKDFQKIEVSQKWLNGVQSFRLDRKNVERSYQTVYLVASDEEGATFIFDSLEDAIAIKYKSFDLNGDGKSELLVFYHSGGNAYLLAIYSIADEKKRQYNPKDIVKWENKMECSNQYSYIEVEKEKITVITHNYEKGDEFLEFIYKVKGTSIEEVSKKSYKKESLLKK